MSWTSWASLDAFIYEARGVSRADSVPAATNAEDARKGGRATTTNCGGVADGSLDRERRRSSRGC